MTWRGWCVPRGVHPDPSAEFILSIAEGLRMQLVEGLGMLPEHHRDLVREGDTEGV